MIGRAPGRLGNHPREPKRRQVQLSTNTSITRTGFSPDT